MAENKTPGDDPTKTTPEEKAAEEKAAAAAALAAQDQSGPAIGVLTYSSGKHSEANIKARNLFKKWITVEVYKGIVKNMGGEKLETKDLNFSEDAKWHAAHMDYFPFTIQVKFKRVESEGSVNLKMVDPNAIKPPQYSLLRKDLVAKVIPEATGSTLCQAIHQLYKQDLYVGGHVIPGINNQLKRFGFDLVNHPAVIYDKLISNGEEILVLEDVCSEGFVVHDYKRALVVTEATHVIKVYARLHAGSLLLKHSKRAQDENVLDMMSEDSSGIYSEEYGLVQKATRGLFEICAHLLDLEEIRRNDKKEKYKKYSTWVRAMKANASTTIGGFFESEEKFKVVSHGSSGGNPLYFRKNKKNNELEVCLSDFSGAKIYSVAADINNFLFTCLDSKERNCYSPILIPEYYSTFSNILTKGGLNVPFTVDELQVEVKKKILTGWYAGITSLAGFMGGKQSTADLGLFHSVSMDQFIAENKRKMVDLFNESKEFRKKYLDMYDYLESVNYLD